MKKTLSLLIVAGVISGGLFLPLVVSAHMMDGDWDLGNSDPRSVGELWMKKMMGQNYENYKKEMVEMMGEDFFQKMQEFMGKSFQSNKGYLMMPMMGAGWSSSCGEISDGKTVGGMMGSWSGSFWGWVMGFLMILAVILFVGIPLGVFVLLVILIVKLIKSLKS